MANTARVRGISSDPKTSTYMDFLSRNLKNLTATGITPDDAALDAVIQGGATASETLATSLIANAVNSTDWTANAAGGVFLPPAIAGTHLALKFTGDMDEATALTIACNGWLDDVAGVATSGNLLAYQLVKPEGGVGVHTAGTAAAPTSVNLIYTPAAADTNCLGASSYIHFFCLNAGEWMVGFSNVPEGTGATGTFTVS